MHYIPLTTPLGYQLASLDGFLILMYNKQSSIYMRSSMIAALHMKYTMPLGLKFMEFEASIKILSSKIS